MTTATIDLDAVLDDGHRAVLDALPPGLLDLTDIPRTRAGISALLAALPALPLPDGVEIQEVQVPGPDGAPDVRGKVYRPSAAPSPAPVILWIHGGGMVLMDADGDDDRCAGMADRHSCVVVSVDYRLAPEHPQPAALEDCYAALEWLATSTDELGVDGERILVGGASAGGGLAAGTALMARDRSGPALAGQLLVYPMLDHRNESPSSQAITDDRVWNREANRLAWAAYLGGGGPTPYASPSTADDLAGLPPAYVNVGSYDMFLDEDVDYALRLLRAGTPCELHVYPGAFHGSNGFVSEHPLSQRWAADEAAWIDRIFGG